MKKTVCQIITVLFASFLFSGCIKNDDKTNYLQVGGKTYDIASVSIENYGPIDGTAYYMGLTLATSGITFDSGGHWQGTGTVIWFVLSCDVNDGISTGKYKTSFSSDPFTLLEGEYCLTWPTSSPASQCGLMDMSKTTVKVVRNGSNYTVSFSGKDFNSVSVLGNFTGLFTVYDFSSRKSGGSH